MDSLVIEIAFSKSSKEVHHPVPESYQESCKYNHLNEDEYDIENQEGPKPTVIDL